MQACRMQRRRLVFFSLNEKVARTLSTLRLGIADSSRLAHSPSHHHEQSPLPIMLPMPQR